MARVLITRAAPEAQATAARVAALGHEPILAPMLQILFVGYPDLPLTGAQALLFTSVHGVRAFAAASAERRLRVLAVGDATAAAALSAGFRDVTSADGDAAALASLAADALDPRRGRVIHVAGADVAGDLVGALTRAGFDAERRIVYRADSAQGFPDDIARRLCAEPPEADVVLFHSPRGAQVFAEVMEEAGLAEVAAELEALCLSKAVAKSAEALPFGGVRVAREPKEDALLALLPAGVKG